MLSHRLLLGPVFIALVIALLWLDQWLQGAAVAGAPDFLQADGALRGGIVVFVVIALLVAEAAREIARFLPAPSTSKSLVISAAALLGLASMLCPAPLLAISLAAVIVVVGAVAAHAPQRSPEQGLQTLGTALFAFIYLGLFPAAFVLIRENHTAWTLLAIVLTIKSCDIGAYFTGRAIGRHKLILWLSPGKTWEGLVGGVLTAAAIGALLIAWLGRSDALTPLDGAILGAVLALVGQAGDLVASFLKRSAGVKNSGAIPGFGGVLDLVDSTMLTAPVALALLQIL